jgi:hypothetical protein
VFLSVVAGALALAANVPVGPYLFLGVPGVVSGLAILGSALAILRKPSLRRACGAFILWFASVSLVVGLFWIGIGLSLSAPLAFLTGVGGVSASVLGLWGGTLASARGQ